MIRVYQLKNLNCPQCAVEMEIGIEKIPGVYSATVSFTTHKLRIEADNIEAILPSVKHCIQHINPACYIV